MSLQRKQYYDNIRFLKELVGSVYGPDHEFPDETPPKEEPDVKPPWEKEESPIEVVPFDWEGASWWLHDLLIDFIISKLPWYATLQMAKNKTNFPEPPCAQGDSNCDCDAQCWEDYFASLVQWILDQIQEAFNAWLEENPGGTLFDFLSGILGFPQWLINLINWWI